MNKCKCKMCNFCKDNDFFQTGFANTSANTLLAEMIKDSQDVQIKNVYTFQGNQPTLII